MKKIYVSELVFITRVDLPTLERVHVLLSNFCGDNGFVYIDNRNIKGHCLNQDELHLLDTSKKILEEGSIGLFFSGFEAIRENRLKYVNNHG